jgi:hypothetical protein
MINLDEIEARANAATPGPWEHKVCSGSIYGAGTLIAQGAWPNSGPFIAAARTDVPALIARVRELETGCERMKTFAAQNFSQMIRQDAEQMRSYGLSYEGVRKVLREYDDGEISFGKLMDLIRAAAQAMADDRVRELEAERDAYARSHAILRAIHGALTDALPSTPIPALDSFDVVELVRGLATECAALRRELAELMDDH